MRQLLLLAVTCLLAGPALGNLEMICPPTLPVGSPMYTELTSGPRTIVFREVYQPGGTGPFRVTVVSQANQCILLDRVPFNEDNTMTTRNYSITVMIPDFECRVQQGCALVVENIRTGNRTSAPIYIRSTTGNKPFTCPDSSRANNWPYNPSPIYGASLSGLGTSATAIVDAVVIGDSLAVRVNFNTPFSGGTGDIRFSMNGGSSFFLTVPASATNSSFRVISDGLPAQTVYSILDGMVTVEISAQDGGRAISGRLIQTSVAAMGDVPYKPSTSYSLEGWLNSDFYVGQYARSSFFVKPYGSCATTTRFFGFPLQSSQDGVTAGGTAGLQLTENRAWFSIDMYNLTSPVTAIELRGQATATIDLLVFWNSGAHVDGVVMVNDEMRRRIVAGISSVWVATERNRGGEISGMLQEGMTSFLESGLEVPPIMANITTNGTGTAFVFVTGSGDISVHVTLNSLTSLLTNAHLHGPAFQGDTSGVLFDMSDRITQQAGPSSWLITAVWRNVSASHLLYLREGIFYLNMHTLDIPSGELRGQVTVLGDWMCPHCPTAGIAVNQCYWSRLQTQINVPNTIRPFGEASVIVDRVLTLQYSVSLWYLQPIVTYTVRLQGPQGETVASSIVSTTPSTYSSNTRLVEGIKVDVTAQELQWAEDGMLMLNVTSAEDPNTNLVASVPPFRRSRCPQQRYMTAVGGQLGWSPGVAYPADVIKALSGDSITFNFTSPDDVYLFDNKNRYDGCVFTVGNTPTARLLAASPDNNDTRTMFVYTFAEPGIYYFGSRANCQADPPMKIAYNATAAVSTGQLISSDYCSQSLYSIANDQLVNIADSLVVVGVLIGIVVGFIILGVAVALTFVLRSRQKGGYDVSEKGGGDGGVAKGDGY